MNCDILDFLNISMGVLPGLLYAERSFQRAGFGCCIRILAEVRMSILLEGRLFILIGFWRGVIPTRVA